MGATICIPGYTLPSKIQTMYDKFHAEKNIDKAAELFDEAETAYAAWCSKGNVQTTLDLSYATIDWILSNLGEHNHDLCGEIDPQEILDSKDAFDTNHMRTQALMPVLFALASKALELNTKLIYG